MQMMNFRYISLFSLFLFIGCAGVQTAHKAEMRSTASCLNCGMINKEWAQTNHEFTNSEGTFRTCSIHCVADMSLKSGETPRNVKAASYSNPERMIPAEKAVYVIGSTAPGTMTMVSKLAFESREAAEKFMAEKGGKLATFSEALEAATAELITR